MELCKSLSNPMLVGCIELVKSEDTPEHRSMFLEEFIKASLLSPAIILPEPVAGEDGSIRLTPESKFTFPMLTAPDGKMFFVGFTDTIEYRKWTEKNRELPTFSLNFGDYVNLILRAPGAAEGRMPAGVVINPMGGNLVVPTEVIASVAVSRMGFRPVVMKPSGDGAKENE